ncbi:MAG: hypothetical protein AABX51_00825 [Nanoarchaeota archaeon]
MAIGSFTDLFLQLQNLGILDSLIPFILIFTIVFASLDKAQILGVGKRNMNAIVALCIGLLVVIPHIIGAYPPNKDPITIMNTAIPNLAVVAIAIVMALVLAGVFGFQFIGGQMTGAVLIFSVAIVVFYFGQAMNWWNILIPALPPETKAMIIALLIFGLIIWFITRDDAKATNVMGWYEGLNNALHKPK